MANVVESLIHRDYAALVAAVPLLAAGTLAGFARRDRAAAETEHTSTGRAPDHAAALPRDLEFALIGVLLAVMADRIEHDPAAYPALADAAARLVPAGLRGPEGPLGFTGLTERAGRAAVQVLRPTALSSLVRALTVDCLGAQ